jgi:DNA-binding CsgD family transcriptional regulator
MLNEETVEAVRWGELALDLAVRLGDERTRAHALVNLGTARIQLDPGETGVLLEAYRIADASGNWEEGARALVNIAFTLMLWAKARDAVRYAEQSLAYSEEHELQNFVSYSSMTLAWLRLRAGEWEEAERMTHREIGWGSTVPQLLARTVLAELAVRRGDEDAPALIVDLETQAGRAGDLQRLVPVMELASEWALTAGEPMPTGRIEELLDDIQRREIHGWGMLRVAGWAAVAGILSDVDGSVASPYAAMAAGDWSSAAGLFGKAGWPYDRAIVLSLLDDEEALVEALETARRLGAAPLERRAAIRLRKLGFRVPHGPREATRSNPAGLTPRQVEVLVLLAEGLTNAEIADRLVLSQRTAEHHVAAVLAKLGASSRREAARRAAELHLLSRPG